MVPSKAKLRHHRGEKAKCPSLPVDVNVKGAIPISMAGASPNKAGRHRPARTVRAATDWSRTWARSRNSIFRRSEEHTSELQSLMRISYAVFCLKKQKTQNTITYHKQI